MIKRNEKIAINGYNTNISTPKNVSNIKIVSSTIELVYLKYHKDYGINISADDILFIGDDVCTDYIDIPISYFNEIYKDGNDDGGDVSGVVSEDASNIISIPAMNAYKVGNNNYFINFLNDLRRRPALVIVGSINIIPRHILDTIIMQFGKTKIVTFGDELLDSPEIGDHCAHQLTNSEYTCVFQPDEYRVSDVKRINITLAKLRDRKQQELAAIPTNANNVTREHSDTIDITEIAALFEEEGSPRVNIVVPNRFLTEVNTKLHNALYGSYNLSLDIGDTFYSRLPFVGLDDNKEVITVPALSTITINEGLNASIYRDGRRIILKNISVTTPDSKPGEYIRMNNVPIDYSGYILNFDADNFPDNMEDYQEIGNFSSTAYDLDTLSLIPFRVFTDVEQKYIKSKVLRVYVEMFSTDIYGDTNKRSWYQSMCNAIEELHIIHDTELSVVF